MAFASKTLVAGYRLSGRDSAHAARSRLASLTSAAHPPCCQSEL